MAFVWVGTVQIGGGAPVSVQSMTNTDTRDAEATAAQINALSQAGADIVRVAVYDMDCARAIRRIKELASVPIVADVHFDYKLAVAAAENGVDKLRINPGNIGSENGIRLLVDAAKNARIPIRVGANSGSLPERLLREHGGPTAKAIAAAALEHVIILERLGFYDIVISLKSSSVPVTVEAYRLIAKQVAYPLHVGVTEAGYGMEAAVKSSVGIGALLLDGIGDTLRVSMTGDPVQEVTVAKMILGALGLDETGIEIIACPTCGRCSVDLLSIASSIRAKLPNTQKRLKLAVMGCVVNGPGEAKDADLGVAFGEGKCALFKNGKLCRVLPACEAESAVLAELASLL